MRSHRDHAHSRGGRRAALCVGFLVAILAACGQHLPGRATSAPTLGPRPTQGRITAFDATYTGALPRSAVFAGLRFTVDRVDISNTHPYAIIDHGPGANVFWTLHLAVENVSGGRVEYVFDERAFSLRTWSGEVLTEVDHPGARRFGGQAGQRGEDTIVFGKVGFDTAEAMSFIDGAQLLIGRSPDARARLPLSGPPPADDASTTLVTGGSPRVHVGAIDWEAIGGLTSLDRPADVPRTATGERANEGERFVQVTLRGTVNGSRYGQATVSSDGIRLIVDGAEVKAIEFRGKANVQEGESTTFTLSFLAQSPWTSISLRMTDPDGSTGSIELVETGRAP